VNSETVGRRVGLLGGTFDPVHLGHLNLAEHMREKLGLSQVVLIPTCMPPHKNAPYRAPAQDRLEMCRIAAQSSGGIAVSDIEIERGGASYTIDTLTELHGMMPDAELCFIMGADMFLTLEQWRNFPGIAGLAELCAASRHSGETRLLEKHAKKLAILYGARCHIEEIPVVDMSSTEIRSLIAQGKDVSAYLPRGVYEYILRRGLYGAPANIQK
jgi:nicotinate-nucleotide adenylyltransferase